MGENEKINPHLAGQTMNALPKDLQRIIFGYLEDEDLFKIMDMIDPNDIFWKQCCSSRRRFFFKKMTFMPEGTSFQYIWERMYYQNILSRILWYRDDELGLKDNEYWVDRMCNDEVFLARHVNIPDRHGSTLLQYVINHEYLDKVKKVLTHGKNIDFGYCLDRAVIYPTNECTKLLLDAGADVNQNVVTYGMTVLLRAAFYGRIENVKLLIEYGADVTRKNDSGRTAYDLAMMNDHHKVAEFLKPFFSSS